MWAFQPLPAAAPLLVGPIVRSASINCVSTVTAVATKTFGNDVLLRHPTQEYRKPSRWEWDPSNLAPQAQSIARKMVAAFPFWESSGDTAFDVVHGQRLRPATSDFSPFEWAVDPRGIAARSNSAEEGAHSEPITAGHPLRVVSPFSWWVYGRKVSADSGTSLFFGLTYEYGADVSPFTILACFTITDGLQGSTNDAGSEMHTGTGSAITVGTEHSVYAVRKVATNGLDLLVDGVSVGAPNTPTGQVAYSASGGALGFGVYAGGASVHSGWDLYAAYVFRDELTAHERAALERDPFLPIRPYYRHRIANAASGPTEYQRTAVIACQSTVTAARAAARQAAIAATSTVTAVRTVARQASITATSTVTAARSAGRAAVIACTSTATVSARGVGRAAAIAGQSTVATVRDVTRQAVISSTSTVTAVYTKDKLRTAAIDCTSTVSAARTAGRTALSTSTSTVSAARTVGRQAAITCTSTATLSSRTVGRTATVACLSTIVVPRNVTRQVLIACQSTVTAVGDKSGVNSRDALIACTSTCTALPTVGRTAAISAASTVQSARGVARSAIIVSQSTLATLLRIGRTALIQCQSSITASLQPQVASVPLKSDRASIELGTRAFIESASTEADIELPGDAGGLGGTVAASVSHRSTKASF